MKIKVGDTVEVITDYYVEYGIKPGTRGVVAIAHYEDQLYGVDFGKKFSFVFSTNTLSGTLKDKTGLWINGKGIRIVNVAR